MIRKVHDMPKEGPTILRPASESSKPKTLRCRFKGLTEKIGQHLGGRMSPEWIALGILALFMAVTVIPHPWQVHALPMVVGLTLLTGALLWAVHRFWAASLNQRSGRAGLKQIVFLASTLTLMVVLARGYQIFAGAVVSDWVEVSPMALAFGAPLAAGPILAALFLGVPAGMLIALCLGAIAAFMWPDPMGMFIFYLISGLTASLFARGGRTRLSLIKAGLISSGAGLFVLLGVALLNGWIFTLEFLLALAAVGVGGPLAGVLAAGVAPLIEMAFGYNTDASLMEMASLDNPALQELMLRAPGTYHHSLVVGSLVEAAAKEIGANHLLARVAALYHDIGKIKKPDYFVENQLSRPNRHEKLAPSMSALILISHVKEGVELARGYRLGQPIIDIMAQHHGTRLIHFFYNKGVENRQAAGQGEPSEENFRYPGPRPQTREAGLVMLADTVEAAARSLEHPNPARIKGLVQNQINQIFAEGQLNECELTLKDLHKIAKSFNAILNGIFHQRVEYPEAADKVKKADGDTDSKQQRSQSGQAEPAKDASQADLRRLGMSSGS
jgi:putative nucleotidyltransferase with HDIG domain